jgi:hypothetical protein
MALKCVTCGLLFRSRNELDWHIRQEHLQAAPADQGQPTPPAATPQDRRGAAGVSNDYLAPSITFNRRSRASERR